MNYKLLWQLEKEEHQKTIKKLEDKKIECALLKAKTKEAKEQYTTTLHIKNVNIYC